VVLSVSVGVGVGVGIGIGVGLDLGVAVGVVGVAEAGQVGETGRDRDATGRVGIERGLPVVRIVT
jgi:hypothetical protein